MTFVIHFQNLKVEKHHQHIEWNLLSYFFVITGSQLEMLGFINNSLIKKLDKRGLNTASCFIPKVEKKSFPTPLENIIHVPYYIQSDIYLVYTLLVSVEYSLVNF